MINNLPTLDLHGEYVENAIILTKEFIDDNILLKNEKIVIVHGIGQDILRKNIHNYLQKDKRVLSYKRDFFNLGCTVIKLKLN